MAFLLLESGDFLLQENGDKIILEVDIGHVQFTNEQLLMGDMSSEQLLVGGMTTETLTQ